MAIQYRLERGLWLNMPVIYTYIPKSSLSSQSRVTALNGIRERDRLIFSETLRPG